MITKRIIFITLTIFLMTNKISPQTPLKAETVSLNGSTIYYEVYGEGKPLFLLHAYTQSSKSWYSFLPDYVNDFQVYLVDLKGHGNSGIFKEKLSIKSAAEDLQVLINYLNLTSIDAIGYSYGGEVLFQLALFQPGLINSMIIIGSSGSWNANDFPEWVEYLSYKNIDNLPWMREQQQSEEQIKTILEQMPYYNVNVTDDEMKTIKPEFFL